MKILNKHTRATKDYRGCEFHYTCYTRKDRRLNQQTWEWENDIERLYVCNEFPEITTKSLQELKEKMSNLA